MGEDRCIICDGNIDFLHDEIFLFRDNNDEDNRCKYFCGFCLYSIKDFMEDIKKTKICESCKTEHVVRCFCEKCVNEKEEENKIRSFEECDIANCRRCDMISTDDDMRLIELYRHLKEYENKMENRHCICCIDL